LELGEFSNADQASVCHGTMADVQDSHLSKRQQSRYVLIGHVDANQVDGVHITDSVGKRKFYLLRQTRRSTPGEVDSTPSLDDQI
jgi:hypothetical protein